MENTKILNIPVGISVPTSNAADIIVVSGAIDDLLFSKIQSYVFSNHVCTFDGADRSERVTCATSLLKLDWSHFSGSPPVYCYCWCVWRNLELSGTFDWKNYRNLLISVQCPFWRFFQSQVHLSKLLRWVYDKLVFSHKVWLLLAEIMFKNHFSVAFDLWFDECHDFASSPNSQRCKDMKITCVLNIFIVWEMRRNLFWLALN